MTEDRLEVAQSSRFGTDGLVKEVLVKHLQVELILFTSKSIAKSCPFMASMAFISIAK